MPHAKFTTGHTDTTAIGKYPEKDDWTLTAYYLNHDAIGADVQGGQESYAPLDWAHEMDTTRHGFGNDKPWRGDLATAFATSVPPLVTARSLP